MNFSFLSIRFVRSLMAGAGLVFFVGSIWVFPSAGQTRPMPDGPGKAETQKMCSTCHDLDKSLSLKQDRAGWQRTVEKMVAFGLKTTDAEVNTVVDYLTRSYPADDVPRLKVNEAEALDFESILGVKRSQAAAIIQYREKNGRFKTIEDLKKVPGIDAAKLEEKKDRLIF
ncbi:MAG TPA: helix-hairpin-helix domain-containing protein [Blastocatellia bacterium]|nr:helix-hairpin-helix domain-containing protein [Blastocatellia bacterium]HMV85204.1 helix-hairpin-helix domain-containing protein [Blastocatellia bacterium]HMX24590.1 helix-hairpin-helix domain-containing protein [Blastocatellia bacterium]HMY72292.1 helix-hairpin-helix domain-containing protein [Blastocatellia bacterium]HMZ22687.1 helix-hairpin-helix domain-containing protein [Blastocatellia bacterium]